MLITISKNKKQKTHVTMEALFSSCRTRELEARVEEMENLVEEHPREWQNNLLLHGVEYKKAETFVSLATIVSKLIRRAPQLCAYTYPSLSKKLKLVIE